MKNKKINWHFFFDSFEFFVGIITGVASILTIINFYFQQMYILTATAFAFLGIIAMLVIKILKMKKLLFDKFSALTKVSREISNKLKHEFYILDNLPTKQRIDYDYMSKNIIYICQNLTNRLSEALTRTTAQKVSIIILSTNPDDSSNTDEAFLSVLGRSDNSDFKRFDTIRYQLKENTDFLQIFDNSISHFSASDLIKKSDMLEKATGKPYLSSEKNWQEYFQSRIVVPIRMQKKFRGIASEGYDYLGYICADARVPNAFRENKLEYYIDLLQGIADQLYLYFDKFIINISTDGSKSIITNKRKLTNET